VRASKRASPLARAFSPARRTISALGSKAESEACGAWSAASIPTQPAPQPKSRIARAPRRRSAPANSATKRRIQR
jgi:hypothetical protein